MATGRRDGQEEGSNVQLLGSDATESRGGARCPLGVDYEIGELKGTVLDGFADARRDREALVSRVARLEAELSAALETLAQCEAFISSIGSFSRLLAVEAGRFDNSA
jgi:hypothetical protein